MYDKKLKEYKGKQAEILQSMQRHSRADQNYHITASLVLDLAKRAFDIFQCSETLEKRSLINFVFQNIKLKDGTLVWDLKEPFNIIVKYADNPIWLPRLDSLRLGPSDLAQGRLLAQRNRSIRRPRRSASVKLFGSLKTTTLKQYFLTSTTVSFFKLI